MTRIELWSDFVVYRLSGLSLQKISKLINISEHSCCERDKKLYQMMLDMFPELYSWWKPDHDYKDKRFTDEIAKERKVFLK